MIWLLVYLGLAQPKLHVRFGFTPHVFHFPLTRELVWEMEDTQGESEYKNTQGL